MERGGDSNREEDESGKEAAPTKEAAIKDEAVDRRCRRRMKKGMPLFSLEKNYHFLGLGVKRHEEAI